MATEASLLPMDISSLLNQEQNSTASTLQDDPFLQELMTSQQGIDLFASVFDAPEATGQSSAHGHGPGHAMEPSLDLESLLMFPDGGGGGDLQPTSPIGSEGYTSETSSGTNCNRLDSPAASLTSMVATSGSGHRGVESSSSPTHSPLMSSAFSDTMISQWSPVAGNSREAERRGSGPESSPGWSASPSSYHLDSYTATTTVIATSNRVASTQISSDVRIDVDSLRESASPSSSSSDRKAATLLLTDEEKRLLSEEGISLPTDMPLTKAEQKDLKRIQRKIKNKVSAQESRKRKKEYVEGLEDRVNLSTQRNQQLTKEVEKLRTENRSIAKQLRDLQELVAGFLPSKVQVGTAGTMLMVMVLSFSLFILPPSSNTPDSYSVSNGFARQTRTLLFTETDEFGNVIDPNTRQIISVAGGHTPFPLPPWLDQTPAILQWMNRTRLSMLSRVPWGPGSEGGDKK